MADPYTFTFDVQAYLKEQETAVVEAPEQGVMKRPVKDAEPVVENTTDSIKTRMANALKSVFPDSTALGAAPKGDTSAGRSKALNDWTVSTEPFMPRFLGDVPAYMALEIPPVSTTVMGPNMDTLSMQDAQEQAAIRSASGITESLGRPAPAGLGGAPVQPETPVIYEEGATITNGKDPSVGSPTPAGLMSPPAQEGVSGVDTSVPIPAEEAEAVTPVADTTDTFATIVTSAGSQDIDTTVPLTSGFDSLVEAEGTDIHLDGRGFVTLPYGIVPDSGSVKKANGTTFDPTGSHGLSASQLSGVDYSGATKFGISRTDYDSDEAFSKAVYAEFGNRTANSYGDGFADLTDEAKQAAYDMAWNAGIGSAGWSSVQTMLTEASKDGDKSKDSLIGFTTNFRSGNDYPRGLLKRRLQTYNLVANAGEEASVITTTAVMKGAKRTGTTYTVKDANGGLLKTWTKPDLDERLGDLEIPQ